MTKKKYPWPFITVLATMVSLFALSSGCTSVPGSSTHFTSTSNPPTITDTGEEPLVLSWTIDEFMIIPQNPRVGQPVYLGADLYISDMVAGYAKASLVIDGTAVTDQQVLIYPDELTPFHFTYIFEKAGTYALSLHAELNPEVDPIFGITRSADKLSIDKTIVITD